MEDKSIGNEREKLNAFGENLARSLKFSGKRSGALAARELMSSLRTLSGIHARLSRKYGGDFSVPSAARWLMDNWYLAQREGLAAAGEFRSAGSLEMTPNGFLLIVLADSVLRKGSGQLDAERCEAFLIGFQRVYPLSQHELSLFPHALRAAAVNALVDWYRTEKPESPADKPAALFGTLRLLGSLDLSDMLDRADRTEQTLRKDPAGIYTKMDDKTRAAYRRRVSELAKKRHIPEHLVAERVLQLAMEGKKTESHVGYYLFKRPLGDKQSKRTGTLYISGVVLSSIIVSLILGFALKSAAAFFLLLLPVSQLIKSIIDILILHFNPPRHLPRMELEGGVPTEGRTICVVSALLTNAKCGERLARRLEEFYLCSRDCGDNILFGLLADLPESKEPFPDGAEEWILSAEKALDTLNERYGGRFFLLTRKPVYSQDSNMYMGWERKRGAIMELARLLCGKPTSIEVRTGSKLSLRGVRYILTLDADTRLAPGAARELIGAMLHPLNTPVVDNKHHVVLDGHAIIQPRIGVALSSAMRSNFARVFAGQGGSDPYGSDTGEVYMDLFESGGFAGKGILDAQILIECLEHRIPENSVLSHDALEGGYLRGAYMGDVELTDGFPSGVLSYYRRLHRWIRGDWQNLRWIGRRGREFPKIEKWRLFDSIRRSLVPPALLISFLFALFISAPAMFWTGIISLFAMLFHYLITLVASVFRSEQDVRQRLLSPILHGAAGGLVQMLLRLILLPYEAYICFSAAAAALWRMYVSHKKMLEWQTAAQTDSLSGLVACLKGMWPACFIGLFCMLFCPGIMGRAAGIIWLISPWIASALEKPIHKEKSLPEPDKNYLLQCAAEIWRYFDTFCGPEDHFLPPDNFQERPPVGCAHRTSPTNIGLCLVSSLCAADLGVTSADHALGLIENLLATMERMPKWNGHLYNWYDTRTLRSLQPSYVSTVDSGNLAGCLIVLREGLLEHDRPDLAERANALLRGMDFRPLYSESRRLFHIGIEPESGELTEGWYDLLASEVRLAGFIAVALGQISRKHWRRLGRAQVQCDGFRGMASWTGTMFEYFMPELFLPLYRGSLLYESASFCLYVQKKRTAARKIPWGISESAFFSLDASLSYRYKAHGCARLALQNGMDKELVISPYSSFLALTLDPGSVVKNLRALDELGARGPYGFWEAVDFTPSRCSSNQGQIVRCVMAHHLGMSMISIANCLLRDVCRRRFMRDPSMAAHRELLQEKLPIGGILLHKTNREVYEKPRHWESESWRRQGTDIDYVNPDCCVLSNGLYSLVMTESGLSIPMAGTFLPYRAPRSVLGDSERGLSLYIRTGKAVTSLYPVPNSSEQTNFSWIFDSCQANLQQTNETFFATIATWVSPSEAGEVREITIRSREEHVNCELLCLFEPVLNRKEDYVNHISYSRLGIQTIQCEDALLIRRIPKGDRPAAYMCAACSESVSFSSDGFRYPARGGLNAEFRENSGWQSESIVAMRMPLELSSDTDITLRIALCIGAEKDSVLNSAKKMLQESAPSSSILTVSAEQMKLSATEVDASMKMIKNIVFPGVCSAGSGLLAPEGKEGLWKFGISGDLPIVCCEVCSSEQIPLAEAVLRRQALLSVCGLNFDLVFLTDDGGDYRRPCFSALSSALRHLDRDACIGVPGGIHFVDVGSDLRCLFSASVLVINGDNADKEPARVNCCRETMADRFAGAGKQSTPQFRFNDAGQFEFYVNCSLPPRPWGNILTNGVFSYNALDTGTGSVWYKNARECPVTPWVGDPSALSGPEILELVIDGIPYSLFATPHDRDCRVVFEMGAAVWEKTVQGVQFRLTAFIPIDMNARVFLVESDAPERLELRWCAPLQLSPSFSDASQCALTYENNLFRAENPRSPFPDAVALACFSEKPDAVYSDRLCYLTGEEVLPYRCGEPCFAAMLPLLGTTIIVMGCDAEDKIRSLCSESAARRALEQTKSFWKNKVGRLKVSTPSPALNHLLNGWCAYQALACRCMARSSVYQSGGAIGFRDQLQDYVNLMPFDENAAREHILCCCAHQFEEGDVQHWWHPGVGGMDRGVRTRCSDDLLWLPWAVCEYVESTGDETVCYEQVVYLSSQPLGPDEQSRYETPSRSAETDTVLDHCRRALKLVESRGVGANGLLLIGSGDWNDGFDRVGENGIGTSVWLTWFFSAVAHSFSKLLNDLGQPDAAYWEEKASLFGAAADNAWDGNWYLRGRFDNGAPLGGSANKYCRIDSIAQSFASLCPEASTEKKAAAIDAAIKSLYDPNIPLTRLFTPPFEPDSEPDPGYISAYGPGFRENGGQYTHGAIWLAMACFRENRADDGWKILKSIMPEERDISVYGAEPFVLAADIYSNPDCPGRAGWSWYTGSAGWFLRVAMQDLLGFRLIKGKPFLDPHLPKAWTEFSAEYTDNSGKVWRFGVNRGEKFLI